MNNKEIHYKYAISYLLFFIILIVSLFYFDTPNLVDKFTFALTMSSLLLAILAIFYTIISANKQDSQFVKIIEANAELSSVTKSINQAELRIADLTKDIPEHFKKIGSKIDDISFGYKSLSEKDEMKVAEPGNQESSDEDVLTGWFSRLHFGGMAVLYIFIQASYKGKNIKRSDFEGIKLFNRDYAIGILNGIEVTGLLDFKLHEGTIIPTFCDAMLYKEYRNHLKRMISVIDDDSSKGLNDFIEIVDKKFS